MRKKKIICIFWILVFLCSGCGGKESSEERKEAQKIQIGVLFDTYVIPRWQRDRDVFVSTVKELGGEVNVQNANGDKERQVQQMNYLIEQDMDAIAVVPIDSEILEDAIKKAQDYGIPVLSYDRLVKNGGTDGYISFDNEEVGTLMGEAMAAKLEEESKILMICGPLEDNNVHYVEKGFREAIKKKNIQVLDTTYVTNWDSDEVEDYLNQNMDLVVQVQGIMCGNDSLAGQTITTLAQHQLAGKIVVVGQDADLDACQRIVEGTQYMTVYKPIDELASAAAKMMMEMAKGSEMEKEAIIFDGTYEIPTIYLEPIAVTKENMDETVIAGGFHLKEDVYLNAERETDKKE